MRVALGSMDETIWETWAASELLLGTIIMCSPMSRRLQLGMLQRHPQRSRRERTDEASDHRFINWIGFVKCKVRQRQENQKNPVSAQQENQKNLVLSARAPKGGKVLLGTLAQNEKEGPVVLQEKQVLNGEVQVSKNDLLKRIIKCSLTGCAGAAGCVVSGPGWGICLCLSCGTVVAACSLTEIFIP
jgi:hypothetical protein